MAEITASMVKELREKTDAPMMECKKALTEANGDLQRAEEILRVKLGNKASKAASRITAEGVIGIHVADDPEGGRPAGRHPSHRVRGAIGCSAHHRRHGSGCVPNARGIAQPLVHRPGRRIHHLRPTEHGRPGAVLNGFPNHPVRDTLTQAHPHT